jgi:hypothetical protein
MKPSDGKLVPYGVVGFERGRGGWLSGSGLVVNGGERRIVRRSESLPFDGPDGGSVTITAHSPDDIDWDHARTSAVMNPYLASPRGAAAYDEWNRVEPSPRPENVEWTTTTISVDGHNTPFEICDLGDGYWAAIGEVPAALVTIDGRGVSVSAVALERLASREPPPPIAPDVGDRTTAVIEGLDDRFTRVPFDRVHRWADYWALRDIEIDHIKLLGRRENLSEQDLEALESYWLMRLQTPLSGTLEHLRSRHMGMLHRPRLASRLGSGFVFQLWFNTVGPGAKTWFGNRYTGIRHYTLRLWWRP